MKIENEEARFNEYLRMILLYKHFINFNSDNLSSTSSNDTYESKWFNKNQINKFYEKRKILIYL